MQYQKKEVLACTHLRNVDKDRVLVVKAVDALRRPPADNLGVRVHALGVGNTRKSRRAEPHGPVGTDDPEGAWLVLGELGRRSRLL
jgi:hypothetical protein